HRSRWLRTHRGSGQGSRHQRRLQCLSQGSRVGAGGAAGRRGECRLRRSASGFWRGGHCCHRARGRSRAVGSAGHRVPQHAPGSLEDMIQYQLRSARLSRRRFGALSLGAGASSLLPPLAGAAAEVQESEVDIKTPDGTADAHFVHPSRGAHPAVLMWPDIYGLRLAFRQMGKRLAESGYAVLVVNPFYRTKRAPTAPEHADFEDPATRAALMALAGSLTAQTAVTDAKAFVAWLDGQPSVDRRRKMGTCG